ncbi:MAG: six-cysteine ranthipeptide SCIFF [Clostridia bacterium]|nr:six-cysteine ranthipeptide SCIFF [Clostridia bacterium]
MKHINSIVKNGMKKTGNIGCGECQSSCQSACKTSCTVGNQSCQHRDEKPNTVKKPLL